MSNATRSNQPKTRSLSLGKFFRSRSRYVHVSAEAGMLPDPANPEGPRTIPWTQRPGVTYDIGRNKAKREERAARKSA